MKAQVGVVGGVLPGFVTGIHKESVRRWNLWFPSAGVFAKVLARRATGTQITFPVHYYNGEQRYEQFSQVSRLYRALILLGLAVCHPSASVFSHHGAVYLYIFKKILLTFFSLSFSELSLVGLALDLVD